MFKSLLFSILFMLLHFSISCSVRADAIFNRECSEDVENFQQASNAEAVTSTRHALLLCLADASHVEQAQISSFYMTWPDTMHFKLYGTKETVDTGNDVSLGTKTFTATPTGKWRASGGVPACSCAEKVLTRGVGGATSPHKLENPEWFATIDLGKIVNADASEISQLENLVAAIKEKNASPLMPEIRAPKVVDDLADFGSLRKVEAMAAWDGVSTVATLTDQATEAISGLRDVCWCDRVFVPSMRGQGDGVPSVKKEDPFVWFHRSDKVQLSIEAQQ